MSDQININQINWDKVNGLIPVIIQDSASLQVLMLGYMNKNALSKTIETNFVTFYSRTKKRLWQKGETSGNTLQVVSIYKDCDQDSLLIIVNAKGKTCHLNRTSCFNNKIERDNFNILNKLENIIEDRANTRPKDSYTSSLISKGLTRIAQKVGEESVEVVIAAVNNDESLLSELADLVFHILILLKFKNLQFIDICRILEDRHK